MADIFQMTFLNALSWKQSHVFWIEFDCSLFSRIHFKIADHTDFVPAMRHIITWTINDTAHRHIYASLGLDVLNKSQQINFYTIDETLK